MNESNHNQASPDVTIVIPIYNEEVILQTAVVDLIDRLKEVPWSYEIILTENGSTDDTVAIAQSLGERFDQVRSMSMGEPNYGRALREGIYDANGTFVICDEIDLCDTDFHERALDILRANQADLVVGSKTMAGASDERPLFRRSGTLVINGMLKLALGFKGTDTHGLKAFRRDALLPTARACVVDKDLFASELVIRAERGGIQIKEIPIRVQEMRPPSIGLARRVPHVLKNMARLVIAIRIKG